MNRGVLICTTVLLLVATCYSVATTSYTFSLTGNTTPFPHFWEQCVGSGHALLALRADYRSFLQRCRTELGFTHVRFHGLLDDDMSTYTTINGAPSTSFFNVDSIFDFLRSIDMRPVVEVSFMPELLASGNSTIMHYQGNITPPSSYPAWNQVIQELITHLVARYGIDEVRQWPFEIWNEPNCGFWTGTQQDYYDLYNNTAHAIKSVDSQLLVGGPATCQSAWLSDFVTYTTQNNIPLDFVSTHEYPTDMTPPLLSMTSVVSQARSEVGSLPLYYTEYNDGLYEPTFHDTSYAAAFIAKNAHDVQGYVDLWSWWTFSDIFEEQGFSSIPFNDPNGWGLLNRYGTAKPSYRAFQLLHQIGTEQLPSTNSTASGSTVEAYATRQTTQGQKTRVDVVAININIPTNTGTSQTINIQVNGFPSGATIPTSATLNLIDPKHCNPAQLWEDLGSPMYPTPAQLDLLDVASMLSPTQIKLTVTGSSVTFSLTLLPQSVAFVSLEY